MNAHRSEVGPANARRALNETVRKRDIDVFEALSCRAYFVDQGGRSFRSRGCGGGYGRGCGCRLPYGHDNEWYGQRQQGESPPVVAFHRRSPFDL
jgi:hypothetical protein